MAGTAAGNLGVALGLAGQGLHVFPCQPGGDKAKSPMPFIKWRDASTTDERKINEWWLKWPDAAIGLDVGKSGLLVIDCDRHGEHDGVEAFGKLMAENGFDPDSCPMCATPNEGNHLFFKNPDGLGNAKGDLPQGVDVRGKGGYVVAPGTTMADGRYYEGFGDLHAAPDLPAWLLAILQAEKGGRAPEGNHPKPHIQQGFQGGRAAHGNHRIQAYCDEAIAQEIARVAAAPSGARNNTLNEAAFSLGQLVGAGWVQAGEIEALLSSAAQSAGLKQPEISKTIRSGLQSGQKEPRQLPEDAPPTIEDMEISRRLLQNHDGTVHDAETGEIVETVQNVQTVQEAGNSDYPGGLVGRIAQWIVATSRRKQPELAIGAALAIVGTVAGRQFAGPTRSGTHLYVLGLAPTGAGKDHPLQQVGRIMTAANLAIHLGPSEFISMPAVVNFLGRKPLAICAMDEFGGFMKRINAKRASGFEGAISKILRQMWSTSFAPYATPEWAGKESVMIHAPCLSLYGASTPEQFYTSMEGAALEDGTLNRFLLINGREQSSEQDPQGDPAIVPADIIRDLQFIYYRSGQLAATWRNQFDMDPTQSDGLKMIEWCPDGSQERYKALSAEMVGLSRADPVCGPFYARTAEMAVRIATILAIGRLDGSDNIRLPEIEYATAMARQSADMMAEGAADYMSENEHQANAQKIVRIVKARGGVVRHRDLLRGLQRTIRARDLRELLAFMVEDGTLEKVELRSDRGPPTDGYRLV